MSPPVAARSPESQPIAIAIETSTRRPSVAAARIGGEPLVRHLEGERPHASDLLPQLDALLTELGADKRAIARVVVGLGPGSLTGLRVGAATALGIARAAGADLVGVSSFEVAAASVTENAAAVLLIDDARGERFNTAIHRVEARGVVVVETPASLDAPAVEQLVERFANAHAEGTGGIWVLADDASRARFQLEHHLPRAHHAAIAPCAGELLRLGSTRAATGPDVAPLYLRDFEVRAPRRR